MLEGRSQKYIFWPFGPQFGLKMEVGGSSPGSATVFVHIHIERPVNGQCPVKSRLCLIKSLEDMDTLFSLSFKLLIMGNLIL